MAEIEVVTIAEVLTLIELVGEGEVRGTVHTAVVLIGFGVIANNLVVGIVPFPCLTSSSFACNDCCLACRFQGLPSPQCLPQHNSHPIAIHGSGRSDQIQGVHNERDLLD